MEPDFSGYATKAGLKCSDGRTITAEAFAHMNGQTVPLVWQHGHGEPTNVLGHVLLEGRQDGMYAKGYFNSTPHGLHAKAMVQHKDINSMSIYANQLKEHAKKVLHGVIREVSLVLSGANPGAKIDFVAVQHDGGVIEDLDDEAIITTGMDLEHASLDDEEETVENEETEQDDEEVAHAAATAVTDTTVQDVVDSMDDKQKNVLAYLVAAALEKQGKTAAHSDKNNEGDLEHQEGNEEMPRNVFEQNGEKPDELKHTIGTDDVRSIMQDAIKLGSLRDAVDQYALKHGIDDIEVLFPDAQTIDNMPQFNSRRMEWVTGVLNGTRHSPFARVKTIWADITQAEARARGYIKGNYKIEEWFNVTHRTTDPTTIYKKQKLDRDDVIDITSFDVIAWIKQEMRMMLEEELARAILLGDGRDVADDDKIKDPMGAAAGDGLRSVLNDHELFVTTVTVDVPTGAEAGAAAGYDFVVDAVMDGMEYYKGSGTPTFYTTIRGLNKFFKARDDIGRRLYTTKQEVAAALGVADIVTVEPMNDYPDVVGIIVNLQDYTIGADKGGEVTTFEDFDIDYNQQKYLIETRLSGGLTKIKSAIVIRSAATGSAVLAQPTSPTYNSTTNVVTVPTVTNVVFKNADTGATLAAGAQPALTAGQRLNVQAVAASGYYFENDADLLWSYFRRS